MVILTKCLLNYVVSKCPKGVKYELFSLEKVGTKFVVNADTFKFRYNGLDNSDELTSIFKEGYATGKNAWAPSEGSLPNDSIGSCQTQASKSLENKRYVDLEVQGEEPNNVTKSNEMKNDIGNATGASRHKRVRDEFPPSRPSRKVSSAANVDQYLGRICETVEAMGEKSDNTMQECIKILNEMSAIPKGSELYLFACRLFLKREQRDLFIALEDSELQFLWLQDEKAQHDRTFIKIYSL
ncbi:PIF-like protein [Striga asiatica]|uniref:PIF-like protein n=1 Tax=Striga asiatica TaxID=4170 RepID=A0A5A7PA93_STRAF|nr:PIF-like protein [Striga asiatica]